MSYLSVDEIAICLSASRSTAERVAARMPGLMTADQFTRWVTSFPTGADILTAPVPPLPPPDNGPGSVLAAKTGLIYFIEAVGADRIKIGFTKKKSPIARRRELQTGCPFPLEILGWFPGSMATELALHARFGSQRVMPSLEWFHATETLRRTAKGLSVLR